VLVQTVRLAGITVHDSDELVDRPVLRFLPGAR
jgi:hypothetical protein